ncbi:hypothetical protein ILUMI_22481 [Ignelater luminosus]|uniref:Reverse transcriptase n=1 Tax=Ignelater luminosus TaxID=2038154 RepID=A0A8K0CFR6_IGNLU|nr:hypothetical protein ILUMI_22481 [Ignelater luminosus]
MGDFNTKIGKGKCMDNVGDFGFEEQNERGDRLIQFCQEKDLTDIRKLKIPNIREEVKQQINQKLAIAVVNDRQDTRKDINPQCREIEETVVEADDKDEITAAIKAAKSGKATGPDEVPAEVIKLFEDNGIKLLTRLFNEIYRAEINPAEWFASTLITLPKTKNAKICQQYRTINHKYI